MPCNGPEDDNALTNLVVLNELGNLDEGQKFLKSSSK